MVKHKIPSSYNDALKDLSLEQYHIVAGGTDLMISHRSYMTLPPHFKKPLLFVYNLEALKYVKTEKNFLHIGGLTTYHQLLNHQDIPQMFKEVILDIASPALRYVASLSGNIGNASPAGDALVYLYAMDAIIVVESELGTRKIPIEQVIIGPRHTSINPNEMIKEIMIPLESFTHYKWVKVGGRRADAISKVSFLGCANIQAGVVLDLRIALGAVYKTVVRDRLIEKLFIGTSINDIKEDVESIINLYDEHIQPIDDQRSTKAYRKHVAKQIIKDFLMHL